jgi:CO dehydrogenase/acetyl-CoA synthase alpha subunit
MAEINKTKAIAPLFGKQNYILMLVGIVVMGMGMFLLSGGKSADAHVFNDNEIYSTSRITVAPILIILGLLIEIVAIFRKNK